MSGPAVVPAFVSAVLLVGAPAKEPLDRIIGRAAQWVQRFERDFITVIADETYDQFVTRAGSPPDQTHRQIRSELLFMQSGTPDSWVAVRNVLSYTDDGQPPQDVPNSRDRLTRAIESGGSGGRAALRRLADEGARFNIGGIERNFNSPTFGLQLLDDGHRARFRFRLDGSEMIGPDLAWRVRYDERRHPTLIQANYRDTELGGRIFCRAGDGAVLKTTLELTAAKSNGRQALRTTITVDYAQDSKLGMVVPARMEEEYRDLAGDQVIRGTATYSNYRVFETSARVIVPQ